MELSISHGFIELNEFTLSEINAGGIWGVIGGIATVVGGVATVVGGVALLAVPEPTMVTKYGGYGLIVSGIGIIGGGAAQIATSR